MKRQSRLQQTKKFVTSFIIFENIIYNISWELSASRQFSLSTMPYLYLSSLLNGTCISGNFGQWVNSDIHLQTVKIQMSGMRRLLIRIFTDCLVNSFLFQWFSYEGNKIAVQIKWVSEFTRLYTAIQQD